MKNDEKYVEFIEKCWKQHEDAMGPTHEVWKELWQLYQNKQDWSKKMSWQSKCFIPKIMMQVEKASGEVKRAILQTRKLFKFELDDSREAEQIQELKETLTQSEDPNEMAMIQQQIAKIKRDLEVRRSRMQMREKQFKNILSNTSFVSVYSEMIKPCFLLGLGIPKVYWNEKGLQFEHIDAFNFAISPDFIPYQKERAPFMIERQELSLSEFKNRAKKSKKWNWKEIKKIEEDAKKLDRFNQERNRRGYGDYSDVTKKVELKFFWGDYIDDEKVEENLLMVVANGKYLVRKQENPFAHKREPYIPTIPMVYPHRGSHGISLMAPQVKLQYTINNIVNMVMDNLNFSVNKMYEYNPNDILNPGVMNSVYPGKMVQVNTTNGQQAVREIITSSVKRDILYFYELIDRENQEGTSITEYTSGLPGKKSKTLGEVELKTAQSRGMFDTIGRDLEINSLQPLLERAYDLCVQSLHWEPREDNYIFVVSGLTVMLMQKELSERIGQILMMTLQSPVLGQMTEIGDLWKKYLDTYNLSPVFKDPQAQGMELNPQQQMNIEQKAQQDAKQAVSQMPPEQIMKLTG